MTRRRGHRKIQQQNSDDSDSQLNKSQSKLLSDSLGSANIYKKKKKKNQNQGNQIMNIPIDISQLSSQLDDEKKSGRSSKPSYFSRALVWEYPDKSSNQIQTRPRISKSKSGFQKKTRSKTLVLMNSSWSLIRSACRWSILLSSVSSASLPFYPWPASFFSNPTPFGKSRSTTLTCRASPRILITAARSTRTTFASSRSKWPKRSFLQSTSFWRSAASRSRPPKSTIPSMRLRPKSPR